MGFNSESGETSCEESDNLTVIKVEPDIPKELRPCKRKDHPCPYEGCGLVFSRPWRLATHICTHTGERPFKCKVEGCGKGYVKSQHLKRHIATSHDTHGYKERLKCPHPDCVMEISNRPNLKRHYKCMHLERNDFICAHCNKGFSKRILLRKHIYEHTGINPFRCPECDMTFVTRAELNKHKRFHKNHTCSECGEEFPLWTQLNAHKKLKHPSEFVCEVCTKKFKAKAHLKTHMAVHKNLEEREIFSCTYPNCPRYFYQKRNLTHHIKSSHEGRTFDCTYPDCGRKLCTKQKLVEHMKLHDLKRPASRRRKKSSKDEEPSQNYECEEARLMPVQQVNIKHETDTSEMQMVKQEPQDIEENYANISPYIMLEINMKHEAEELQLQDIEEVSERDLVKIAKEKAVSCKKDRKNKSSELSCEICQKCFKKKTNLNRHFRVHTGDRPFPCQVCNKTFKNKCSLRNHVYNHTGIHPFKCHTCSKSFTRKDILNIHCLTHTSERRFKCDICNTSFTQRGSLNVHVNKHNVEKSENPNISTGSGRV